MVGLRGQHNSAGGRCNGGGGAGATLAGRRGDLAICSIYLIHLGRAQGRSCKLQYSPLSRARRSACQVLNELHQLDKYGTCQNAPAARFGCCLEGEAYFDDNANCSTALLSPA